MLNNGRRTKIPRNSSFFVPTPGEGRGVWNIKILKMLLSIDFQNPKYVLEKFANISEKFQVIISCFSKFELVKIQGKFYFSNPII